MSAYDHLDRARRDLGLSVESLWLAYVGLGGTASLIETGRYFAGEAPAVTARQYDYMAQALNDRYIDIGGNHPVPYSEALRGREFTPE